MIHRERRQGVAVLTIDRPRRRNAVDVDALEALAVAVESAVADGDRVVVLAGSGGHFCAGADLTGVEDAAFAAHLRTVLDALATVPVLTLAAVEGAALGAGTQLASACDLRVAARDAQFGIPAARLGLMVDAATVRRITALAGGGVARAMLLAAEVVDGDSAHRVGFVQRLGGVEDALAWAAELASLAPLTIAGHKLGLGGFDGTPPDGDTFGEAFRRAWSSEDLREGMAAFREKRPPRFRGR